MVTSPHVLLINQSHTANIGDQAIGMVMRRFFEDNGCKVTTFPYEESVELQIDIPGRLTRLLSRVAVRISPLIDYLNRKRIEKLLEVSGTMFDAAIIGGGELLGGHYGFNSAFSTWVEILNQLHIPVLVYGVSGDDHMPNRYLHRYGKALQLCSYVAVRDWATFKLFEDRYGVRSTVYPDVAFTFRQLFDVETDASTKSIVYNKSDNERNVILCIPAPFNRQTMDALCIANKDEYYSYLLNISRKQRAKESVYSDIVFTSTVEEDSSLLQELVHYAHTHGEVSARMLPTLSLQDFVALLPSVRTVVSGRMHAMILALQYGCNIEAIPFKDKLRVFSQEYSINVDISEIEYTAFEGLKEILNMIYSTESHLS